MGLPLKGRKNPTSLVRKHSLHYDGRLVGRFGVWVGTLNFGSLSLNGEVCIEL